MMLGIAAQIEATVIYSHSIPAKRQIYQISADSSGNVVYAARLSGASDTYYKADAEGTILASVRPGVYSNIAWDGTYAWGTTGGKLIKVDFDDESYSTVYDGSGGSYGIAYDAGYFYIANASPYKIRKVDSDGNFISATSIGTYDPYAIAVNSSSNVMYVSDIEEERIYRIVDGEFESSPFVRSVLSYSLALDEYGNLYVPDDDSDKVRIYSPDGTLIDSFSDGDHFGSAKGIGYHDGKLYVSDSSIAKIHVYNVVYDSTPPDPPSDFIADFTAGTVVLSWSNPEDDFESVTIRRDTLSFPETTTANTAVTSDATVETLIESGLDDGTYYYSIFTLDQVGNISVKATASVTVDATPPSAVSDLAAGQSDDTAMLTWTNPESDFAGVTIRRSTTSYPDSTTDGTAVTSNSTATGLSQTGLYDGTYFYSVFALDSYGNASAVATATVIIDDTAPDAPSFTAVKTASNSDEIVVSWNSVDDAVSYLVRQSINGVYSTVFSSEDGDTLSYTASDLDDGVYQYQVYAYDANDNLSGASSSDELTIDTTQPSAVSELSATASSNQSVHLTWTNPEQDFASVTIRRSLGQAPTGISDGSLVTRNLTATSYTDRNVQSGRFYYAFFVSDDYGNISDMESILITLRVREEDLRSGVSLDTGDLEIENSNDTEVEDLRIGTIGDVAVTLNATLKTKDLVIGDSDQSVSRFYVSTANSVLEDSGDVVLANRGTATLFQSNGQVIIRGKLSLGSSSGGEASYELSGGTLSVTELDLTSSSQTSTFNWTGGTVEATTIVGNLTNNGGTMKLRGSSPTTIQGAYSQQSSANLHIILDADSDQSLIPSSGGDATPIITVSDTMTLSGSLSVELDGFSPKPGDKIQIVNQGVSVISGLGVSLFTGDSSDITYDLPELTHGMSWDTSLFESSGVLQVSGSSSSLLNDRPLNYPNPFVMSTGTSIVYFLNSSATIDLHIYTAYGSQVYQQTFDSGSQGGQAGPNEVPVNQDLVGDSWPSGVYFYLLMNDGEVVGKGKLALRPE